MSWALFIFLGVFSQTVYASSDAQLNYAIATLKNGKYIEGQQILTRLLEKEPRNSVYWFNLGHLFYKQGKLNAALKSYRNVVSLQSKLAPAAKYYSAKVLLDMGKTEESKKSLQMVINYPSTPSHFLGLAKKLLATANSSQGLEELALERFRDGQYSVAIKILNSIPEGRISVDGQMLQAMIYVRQQDRQSFDDIKYKLLEYRSLTSKQKSLLINLEKNFPQEDKSKPLQLALDLSYGQNSNAYSDSQSSTPTKSTETRAFTSISYQYNPSENWIIRPGYVFSMDEFKDAHKLSTKGSTYRLTTIYMNGNKSIEFTPYYQRQSWSGKDAYERYGGTLTLTDGFGFGETGLVLDGFKKTPLNQDYLYLDSTNGSTRFYVSLWNKYVYFELNATGGVDNTKDITYTDGSRLPLSHYYYGPGARLILKLGDKIQVMTQANLLSRVYQNKSLTTGVERRDQETSWLIRPSYSLSPSTSIYYLYEGLHNSSTLKSTDVRDKNYNVNVQSIGISWSFQ